jgi:leucyl aminopeptidase
MTATSKSLTLHFVKTPGKAAHIAVVFAYDARALSPEAKALDSKSGGFITHALDAHETFKGAKGDVLSLTMPKGAAFRRVLLVGTGAADWTGAAAEDAGGKLFPSLQALGAERIAIFADGLTQGADKKDKKTKPVLSPEALAAHMAAGIMLRSYSFEKYKPASKKPVKDKLSTSKKTLSDIEIVSAKAPTIEKLYARHAAVVKGVFLARDFVNEPPNVLYPESYAARIKAELSPLGVKVEIFDEKQMLKMGMGGILAIGMGSTRKPRLVVMHWNGTKNAAAKSAAKKGAGPLALVGKGVTFDTGGISLKPGPGMEEMKMDMGGSAAVVGTLKALAHRKAACNVVGIVPLAENMPSGDACRPADVITSYAGKTIEILNTDAEGRVILADALTYVQQKYKPCAVIDLATLTGAMLVALGHEYCGTFANEDGLWGKLSAASQASGEKLWRMPLDEVWRKEMESPVADIQNIAKSGRNAGSCTAAGFLEYFIEPGMPWAHLDIAGTAWIKADRATVPKYGTGFGVRLLHAMIEADFEQ